jgi:arabinogalactan oligomer/maltooligosaccharide transport system substrate-binding protein
MYYDKSVITNAAHVSSLEDLVADCEAANRNFSYEFGTSGWYEVAPFFGNGCVSEWTADNKGKFVAVKDTFNSDAGVAAAKAIQTLVKSSKHISSSSVADFSAATKSAVVVSGTWAYEDAKSILGDNLGVAELPSVKIGSKSVHLGSFSGYKLVGVKPQRDTKKAAVLHKVAEFLTNEESQLARFKAKSWGPSNKKAQQNAEVLANPALAALAKQNLHAVPQGQIHGSWWDLMKALATAIKAAPKGDDAALKAALKIYDEGVKACVAENKSPWGLVGSFAASKWSTNVDFTQGADGLWTLDYTLAANDEFKVRKGTDWDTFSGLKLTLPAGKISQKADGNLLCETAGEYHFVVDGDAGTLVITAK